MHNNLEGFTRFHTLLSLFVISLKQRHFHVLFDLDEVKLQKFFEFSCTIAIFHEDTKKISYSSIIYALEFLIL